MRTFQVWQIIAATVAFCATALPVRAEQASPKVPPSQLEILEEGDMPQVAAEPPETRGQISEKRAPGGRVTEIKVTNGNSTYYLKPNNFGSAPDSPARTAQWQILQFDLRSEEEEKNAIDAEPLPPPNIIDSPAAK